MGLDALLARLKAESVTPVTPAESEGVTAKPAPILDCTPVTPVTAPMSVTAQDSAKHSRWTLHFLGADPLATTFAPAVSLTEALAAYPSALAAIPVPDSPPAPRGCSACGHRTRFDNCGVPVEAGLVEAFALVKHPTGGAGCAVFERKPIAAEHRVAALLDAGLLDQDDADLIRLRYDDDPDKWDQLLDDIERTTREAGR